MQEQSVEFYLRKLIMEHSWDSLRLRVTTRQAPGAHTKSARLTLEQVYLQKEDGHRFFDDRMVSSTGFTTRRTAYCDGVRCANIGYARDDVERQTMASIGREFMSETRDGLWSAPQPLRFRYVGLTPLHECLPTAEPLGQGRAMGRDCDRFRFNDVGPAEKKAVFVYFLDRETAVPLRVDLYQDEAHLKSEAPSSTWEATSLDAISGRHFPRDSTYTAFSVAEAGAGRWESRPDIVQSIRVDTIEYDVPIRDSAFWPTFQPGATVLDAITRKVVQAPAQSPEPARTAVANAIRVEEPVHATWPYWTGATISLSLIVLALVLRRRSMAGT